MKIFHKQLLCLHDSKTARYSRFMLLLLFCFSGLKAQQVLINEVMSSNPSAVMDNVYYNYSEWIELYNPGDQSVFISGYKITNDSADLNKWQIPPGHYIQAKGFLVIWMDKLNTGLHASFRARSNDELFILSRNSGDIVDSIHVRHIPRNISYGRFPDGTANWRFFENPTPNKENLGIVVNYQSADPVFNVKGGRYNSTVSLEITNPTPYGKIYYTTDGSEPNTNSAQYETPIIITSTKTVKARIIESRKIYGRTVTNTYFISEHHFTLPVVSLSTDPKYLWDPLIGIYTEGTNGIEGYCYGRTNWNQEWERLAHFEYFTPDGNRKIDTDAGIKINGGCSRTFPQKSLGVYFRDKYGNDEIRYPLFESKGVDRFRSIMLRNSGNDCNRTQFQDAMMQTIVMGQMDIDYLGYTPAALYINGAYWGVQNIREKSSEDYLYTNYNLDQDSIDMLEWQNSVIVGDNTDYIHLLDFLGSKNLSVPANYDYVKQQINMESYLDYQIAEIYFANLDWPGNNMKYWKSKKPGSTWRWLMFDTDFGFGLASTPDHNTLTFATETNGPDWPNPPWSTFLFRKLLENGEFRNRFVDKFNVYLNSTFRSDRVTGIIDSLRGNIAAEMPYHFNRWGGTMDAWEWNINVSRDFAKRRPGFMMQYLKDFFTLSSPVNLVVGSNLKEKERFAVNDMIIHDNMFRGQYFSERPVKIKALSGNNCRFDHWEITTYDISRKEIIPASSAWNYLDNVTQTPGDWKSLQFNDSGWKTGKSELGYGDGNETTVLGYGPDPNNKFISYYFRKKFTLADTSGIDSLIIRILADDGAVVYLNGTEVLREYMPSGPINSSTLASVNQLNENTFMDYSVAQSLLVPGENIIAAEVHQISPSSSDISFDLRMDMTQRLNQHTETDNNPEISLTLSAGTNCTAIFNTVETVRDLFINEFCAKNSVIPDETLEYDDWIELYNAGHDTLNIEGLFMTNSFLDQFKYEIPGGRNSETIIPPRGYKLLWADGQPEQGTLHLDFKLEKDGGEIEVIQLFQGKAVVLDSVIYPKQYTNYSYGRYGDATNRWFILSGMTPGESNVYTEISELPKDQDVALFPNPVIDFVEVCLREPGSGVIEISIIDQLGRERIHHLINGQGGRLNVSDLTPGMYMMRISTRTGTFIHKMLKLQE
jgi:hypothetical protein